MWTIAIFYVMGQQFIWPQFMWGYVIMLACFAASWANGCAERSPDRSRVDGHPFRRRPSGELARTAYAVMAVVIAVAFIGFAEFGCGTFLSTFVPAPQAPRAGRAWQHLLAIVLMALTAIYTISAGLIGVGITGFIQFVIVLVGSIVLIVKAIGMGSRTTRSPRKVPPEWFQFAPPLGVAVLPTGPTQPAGCCSCRLPSPGSSRVVALGVGRPAAALRSAAIPRRPHAARGEPRRHDLGCRSGAHVHGLGGRRRHRARHVGR